jgi:hypothetical protein
MKKKFQGLDDVRSDPRDAINLKRIEALRVSQAGLPFDKIIGARSPSGPSDAPPDLAIAIEQAMTASTGLIDPLIRPQIVQTPFGGMPYGFQFLVGAPDSGKSVTSLAIAFWCNAASKDSVARYVALSEPHADKSASSAAGMFYNNLQDVPAEVPQVLKMGKRAANVLIIDSVADAMRTYAVSKADSAGGTMAQGMERSDQLFSSRMQEVCLRTCVCIGVVGTTDVPFIASLEGRVEGFIEVVRPGTFTVKVRGRLSTSDSLARTETEITCPTWAVQCALIHLGYTTMEAAVSGERDAQGKISGAMQGPMNVYIR